MFCFLLALFPSFLCFDAPKSPTKHLISSLPGFSGPLPTRHYSGFVPVDPKTGTTLFYYLVESADQPSTDPIIWWMNGGPGASSLAGLLGENGPLLLGADGKTLIQNPYAFNRHANVLYVEFGPGIGYSFCDNSSSTDAACPQASSSCSPCSASDSSVATNNRILYEALTLGSADCAALFPELKARTLYITGESYAGVYIPTLALELLKNYREPRSLNLEGIWVTDPCTDNKAQFGWLDIGVDYAYQTGLISGSLHATLASDCTSGRTAVGDRLRDTSTGACMAAWRLYDIATAGIGDAVHPAEIPGLPMYVDPLSVYGRSGGPDLEGYFGRADVRLALNATSNNTPNKVYHMEIDNNGYPQYSLEYAACNPDAVQGMKSMLDVYMELLALGRLGSSLRTIIISSGTSDPVVNLQGTEQAVEALGLAPSFGGDRRPWFYKCTATSEEVLAHKPYAWGARLTQGPAGIQMGGFVTNFETNAATSLSFVTMRGSGHMVPAYVPQSTMHVIQNALLQRKPLSPALPSHWNDAPDSEFYKRDVTVTLGPTAAEPGLFAQWVLEARSESYVNTHQ